jgi:hypothetical protein
MEKISIHQRLGLKDSQAVTPVAREDAEIAVALGWQ